MLSHFWAAGYRYRESGALTNVGANGYVWSSSPYAADGTNVHCAGYLNFNAGNVNPLNWASRSNGFPVRCVQHLCRNRCFLSEAL